MEIKKEIIQEFLEQAKMFETEINELEKEIQQKENLLVEYKKKKEALMLFIDAFKK